MSGRRPSEIKKEARIRLTGCWGVMVLTSVTLMVANFLASLLVSRFFSSARRSAFALISAVAVAFILKLLLYLVKAGMTRISLRTAREQKLLPGDIFYAFRDQPDRYLVVGLLFTCLQLLYALPLVFYLVLAGINTSLEIALLTIWAIGGGLFLICFNLTYSMAFALMLDDPALGALDAMKKSAALMRGQRLRLLLMEVSYIGWGVLALLSTLVGLLWILPYHEMAKMLFYLGLVREESV